MNSHHISHFHSIHPQHESFDSLQGQKMKAPDFNLQNKNTDRYFFPMSSDSEHKTQETPEYKVLHYITLALVQKISAASSFSTSTGIGKHYHLYFTELSSFLKSKDMLETCSG